MCCFPVHSCRYLGFTHPKWRYYARATVANANAGNTTSYGHLWVVAPNIVLRRFTLYQYKYCGDIDSNVLYGGILHVLLFNKLRYQHYILSPAGQTEATTEAHAMVRTFRGIVWYLTQPTKSYRYLNVRRTTRSSWMTNAWGNGGQIKLSYSRCHSGYC